MRPRSARYAALAVERAARGPLREREVRVLSAEDFVLFKALSTRPRDAQDAASVLIRMGARLERDVIEREVALLQAEIPDHDTRSHWAEIVSMSKDPLLQPPRIPGRPAEE